MYVYIYIYVCLYIYIYVCICVYIYIYTSTSSRTRSEPQIFKELIFTPLAKAVEASVVPVGFHDIAMWQEMKTPSIPPHSFRTFSVAGVASDRCS